MRKAENPIDFPRGTPWKMQSGEANRHNHRPEENDRQNRRKGGTISSPENSRHSHDRITGTGREVSKVNIQEVLFTPADAAEALETIAWLERDERGTIPARLMYNDPHQPPHWWHVRHMLNLTLLARTVAAQEGTAPAPGNPPLITFAEDPVNQRGRTNPAESQAQAVEGRHRTNPTCHPPHLRRTDLDRHRQAELQVRPARSPIRTRNSTGKPGGRCNPA